ncbi:hypothetical protein ABC255_09525 [Neobacillus sp. 3P2-tot-E-2]|uniref:hypothetical protein n=1 Tax=Neobacillus sp. 3P2-tot-E-2 TaxID=3132212 RepID=UPI0039A049A7
MITINIHNEKSLAGVINQTAIPLQKGDIVEVINRYFDPTTVGDYVYSVRVLKSSNPDVMQYELNSVRLVACYKVDVLPRP